MIYELSSEMERGCGPSSCDLAVPFAELKARPQGPLREKERPASDARCRCGSFADTRATLSSASDATQRLTNVCDYLF